MWQQIDLGLRAFFVEVKAGHRCSALQHATHGYLALLSALKVPESVLRRFRGGLLRAAAHLDDATSILLGATTGTAGRPRAVQHLLHAFVVLDEAVAQFFGQFDVLGAVHSLDKLLRERDDLEALPVFKRFPSPPSSSSAPPGSGLHARPRGGNG